MRYWLRRFRAAFADADENDRAYLRSYIDVCKQLVSTAKAMDGEDDSEEPDDE